MLQVWYLYGILGRVQQCDSSINGEFTNNVGFGTSNYAAKSWDDSQIELRISNESIIHHTNWCVLLSCSQHPTCSFAMDFGEYSTSTRLYILTRGSNGMHLQLSL